MTKEESQQFITGIRVIDVFAPIVLGTVCRLQWCEGTGSNILTAELIQRFIRSGGQHVVCAGCLPDAGRVQEWRADLTEYELDQYIADSWLSYDVEESSAQLDEALEYSRELLLSGEDVLFVLLQSDGSDAWSKRAISKFSELDAEQHFVILTVTNYGKAKVDNDTGECATRIVLDLARARAGLYPPVDPLLSSSTMNAEEKDTEGRNTEGSFGARRLAVLEKARAAFAAYSEIDPDLENLPKALKSLDESGDTHHCLPLFRCCAQALYVATPYTGISGVSQNMEQSLAAFERAMQF